MQFLNQSSVNCSITLHRGGRPVTKSLAPKETLESTDFFKRNNSINGLFYFNMTIRYRTHTIAARQEIDSQTVVVISGTKQGQRIDVTFLDDTSEEAAIPTPRMCERIATKVGELWNEQGAALEQLDEQSRFKMFMRVKGDSLIARGLMREAQLVRAYNQYIHVDNE